MRKKIFLPTRFHLILSAIAFLVFFFAINYKVMAFNPFNGACSGSGASGSSVCQSTSKSSPLLGPDGVITKLVNLISIIAGFVAVIMLLVGGIMYITSGGDPQRTNSAKDTIMYALIGIAVVAMAQIIVHFVLYNLSKTGTPTYHVGTHAPQAE